MGMEMRIGIGAYAPIEFRYFGKKIKISAPYLRNPGTPDTALVKQPPIELYHLVPTR